MNIQFSVFLMFICGILNGQVIEKTNVATDTFVPTPVVIQQDERIEELMSKLIYIEEKAGKSELITTERKVKIDKYGRVNVPGFRIQLMNSTDRAAVYGMKGKLYQIYPTIKQYVIAQAPFYKLRFGNFRTKEEAEKYKNALSSMFPGGIYIVNDIIEAQINPTTTAKPEDKKTNTKNNATTDKKAPIKIKNSGTDKAPKPKKTAVKKTK